MKIMLSKIAMLVPLGFMATSVFAASTGTIEFKGQLTDTTCSVNIDGQGSNATIVLPSVSINDLTEEKSVTGRTLFNMALSKCTIGTQNGKSKVSAFFQPGATVDLASGRLKNNGGTAQNVQLQLLDGSGDFKAINAGSAEQVEAMKYQDVSTDGNATLPYAVEYYAVGKTEAGTVVSSIVYNLQYK